MNYLDDDTRRLEVQRKAAAAVQLGLAQDSFLCADRHEWMAARGLTRYTKGTDLLTVTGALADALPLNVAFCSMADARSLFGQLPDAVRLPLQAAARLQVGAVSLTTVAEAAAIPNVELTFDVAGAMAAVKGEIVISLDTVKATDAATQDGITNLIVGAAAAAVDVYSVGKFTAGSPSVSADVGTLLSAISSGRPARPVIIGGFDTLLTLPAGVLRDLGALNIPVIPCGAASGLLIALDQAGVLISDGGVTIDTARHANVTIDGTATSLFQSNLTAIRATRFMRLTVASWAVSFATVGSPA